MTFISPFSESVRFWEAGQTYVQGSMRMASLETEDGVTANNLRKNCCCKMPVKPWVNYITALTNAKFPLYFVKPSRQAQFFCWLPSCNRPKSSLKIEIIIQHLWAPYRRLWSENNWSEKNLFPWQPHFWSSIISRNSSRIHAKRAKSNENELLHNENKIWKV